MAKCVSIGFYTGIAEISNPLFLVITRHLNDFVSSALCQPPINFAKQKYPKYCRHMYFIWILQRCLSSVYTPLNSHNSLTITKHRSEVTRWHNHELNSPLGRASWLRRSGGAFPTPRFSSASSISLDRQSCSSLPMTAGDATSRNMATTSTCHRWLSWYPSATNLCNADA